MQEILSNTVGSSVVVAHAVLALFGGVVHALHAHRTGQATGLGDVLILTIISSFSGVMFALIAMYMSGNLYITLAAAGSGGFLGVEGLAVLARRIQDMLIKR